MNSQKHFYEALIARDRRFDGVFFVGIKTTGIYCRPVCPSRRPQQRHCEFFRLAAAAEVAGYRPCLRFRPELAPARRLAGRRCCDTFAGDLIEEPSWSAKTNSPERSGLVRSEDGWWLKTIPVPIR